MSQLHSSPLDKESTDNEFRGYWGRTPGSMPWVTSLVPYRVAPGLAYIKEVTRLTLDPGGPPMRRLRLTGVALSLLSVAVLPLVAQQRPSNRIALEQYLDWEEVQTPQLSPDGSQILFSRRWVDKMNDKWESSVWLMNADGSHARMLTPGGDVQWSPDGKRIAYVAKGEPSGSQIFVRWMDAEGAVTQISHLTDSPSGLEWSPDGKSIAFTMNVPIKETAMRIAMPTPPKGAKWIEAPKIVTRLNYRSDRIGYTDDSYRHIFVIPSDGGTARQITNGDWSASG